VRKGGPKKKPLAIIRLHGSHQIYRRKDKDADLKIESSIPVPPDWLSQEAKAEWKRRTTWTSCQDKVSTGTEFSQQRGIF